MCITSDMCKHIAVTWTATPRLLKKLLKSYVLFEWDLHYMYNLRCVTCFNIYTDKTMLKSHVFLFEWDICTTILGSFYLFQYLYRLVWQTVWNIDRPGNINQVNLVSCYSWRTDIHIAQGKLYSMTLTSSISSWASMHTITLIIVP